MTSEYARKKTRPLTYLVVPDEYWVRVESFVKRYNNKFGLTPQSRRRMTNSKVVNGLAYCYARDVNKDDIFFIPQIIRAKQYKIYPILTFKRRYLMLAKDVFPILQELKLKVNKTKNFSDKNHRICYSDIIIYLIDKYEYNLEELIFSLPRSQHHIFV